MEQEGRETLQCGQCTAGVVSPPFGGRGGRGVPWLAQWWHPIGSP